MFLIYHVTSQDHIFNGLLDLMGWSFLQLVTTLPSLVNTNLVVVGIQQLKYFTWSKLGKIDSHGDCVNEHIIILACHVILGDHMIIQSCDFKGRGHSG